MAKRIARFEKVSFEQFREGYEDSFGRKKKNNCKRYMKRSDYHGEQRPVPQDMIFIRRFL